MSMQEQNHPLYSIDRDNVDRLLSLEQPEDGDIVDLARLLLRYEGFPGAEDLREDMNKLLKIWNISLDQLNLKSREIWGNGYRPGVRSVDSVGSGFDTEDKEGN